MRSKSCLLDQCECSHLCLLIMLNSEALKLPCKTNPLHQLNIKE